MGPLIQSALPQAPQGWKRQESAPLPGDVGCGWLSRVWNVSYQAAPEAPGDSSTDWKTRYQEAMSRRDAAEIKRLQEERMHSQARRADQMRQSLTTDVHALPKARASVVVTVNATLDDLSIPNPKASSVSPPRPVKVAGADLAFRSSDSQPPGGSSRNGVTTLYLGRWISRQVSNHLEQTVEVPKTGRDTKVHSIKIVVTADDKRAEELVSAFDWKALRALLEA